jgi:zinc transport system permease protein
MPVFLQDLAQYPFLRYAVVAGLLASIACGVVGSYVVVQRTTYIAGAVSHCVLGGMGIAHYLHTVHGISWLTPLIGATVAALFAALVLGLMTVYGHQRQDTVLSVIWALGMALGITFISKTPGYYEDLMSYLFGNILMVGPRDLVLMAILDTVILVFVALFYNKLLAICFDAEMADLRGVHTGAYTMALLVLTALTVVLLVQVVGIVLVIALLSLPTATAGHLTKRLGSMMLVAVGLCALTTVGGLALSYKPDLPPGATIIEVAAVIYILVLLGRRVHDARRSRTDAA